MEPQKVAASVDLVTKSVMRATCALLWQTIKLAQPLLLCVLHYQLYLAQRVASAIPPHVQYSVRREESATARQHLAHCCHHLALLPPGWLDLRPASAPKVARFARKARCAM